MYIVFGASGYLGAYLVDQITQGTDDPVLATYCSAPLERTFDGRVEWYPLDFAYFYDIDAFCAELNAHSRSEYKVIVLAACHNPDMVRKNPQVAWQINITALAHLVNVLPRVKSFYYVSSDTVYGESLNNHFFDENEAPHPVNLYGNQKTLAEKIVIAAGYNVVRCSFLIGPSRSYKKHFYDQIVDTLREGTTMEMLTDSCRTAISFKQAAQYLVELIERFGNEQIGIVNVAGDEILSKYDIALRIAEKHDLAADLLRPVSFDESNFFAEKRAKSILIKNEKLKKLLNCSAITLEV
jgi:dTDP-4-dehydrorhamnose reductase